MGDEVDRLLAVVRESHFLTTDVSREQSLDFLRQLADRINDLSGEIALEIVKHGTTASR